MLEFFINLLILIFIFFFFVFVFSIILYFSAKIFYKIKNKTKTIKFKTIFKKLILFLAPLYLLLFFKGGCSYKYMDPQYYEFKRLCYLNAGEIVDYSTRYQNQKIKLKWSTINNEPIQVNSRIMEYSYQNQFENGIVFYKYRFYIYDNYGIFLRGDEGAGLYFKYSDKIGCKP